MLNNMEASKKEVENSILFFGRLYGKNYAKLMETTSITKVIEIVIHDMFINRFNPSFCDNDEYNQYVIILDFARESNANGYVTFEEKITK